MRRKACVLLMLVQYTALTLLGHWFHAHCHSHAHCPLARHEAVRAAHVHAAAPSAESQQGHAGCCHHRHAADCTEPRDRHAILVDSRGAQVGLHADGDCLLCQYFSQGQVASHSSASSTAALISGEVVHVAPPPVFSRQAPSHPARAPPAA